MTELGYLEALKRERVLYADDAERVALIDEEIARLAHLDPARVPDRPGPIMQTRKRAAKGAAT